MVTQTLCLCADSLPDTPVLLAGCATSDAEHASSGRLHQVEPLAVCSRQADHAEAAGCGSRAAAGRNRPRGDLPRAAGRDLSLSQGVQAVAACHENLASHSCSCLLCLQPRCACLSGHSTAFRCHAVFHSVNPPSPPNLTNPLLLPTSQPQSGLSAHIVRRLQRGTYLKLSLSAGECQVHGLGPVHVVI